jgi:hypothetical protein
MPTYKYIKVPTGHELYKGLGTYATGNKERALMYGNVDSSDEQPFKVRDKETVQVQLQSGGKVTGAVKDREVYYCVEGGNKGFFIEAAYAKEVGPPQNLGAAWGASFGTKTLSYGPKMTRWLSASSLNVRADFSTDAKVIKKISKGQKVTDLQSINGHEPWCYSKELGGYVAYGDDKGAFWGDNAPSATKPKPSTTVAPAEPTAPPVDVPVTEDSNTGMIIGVGAAALLAAYFAFGRK